MPNADDLLAMAGSDPMRTLQEGHAYIGDLDAGQHYERSVTLRALSLASRHTSKIADSIAYARRSSAVAREGGFEKLALLGVLTETGSLAISGDHEGSLETIESVLAYVEDEELKAEFAYQRAAVLSNMGHMVDAIEAFETVLPVYESLGDAQSVMMTLNHLGRLHTSAGDLVRAEQFLERALALARQNSELASVPGILHNLGLLSAYLGNIPEALERLYESDELYMEISGSSAPQHVARCEVLMSVGLFDEALETAEAIARVSAKREDREHEINALIVAARAALMAERHQDAIQLADRAASVVGTGGHVPILYEARVIGIEARFALQGPSTQLLQDAIVVADDMASEGLIVSALQAKSLAARISFEMGDDEVAARLNEEVASASTGPVELRIQGPLARARLAVFRGDSGKALRSVRSGLSMIDRFQESLGATELRLGIEKLGTELSELGLRLAVDSGRPRQVLDWLDRTRARALRFRPVTPVEDESVRALLADMRRVGAELRKPSNRNNRDLLRRRRELEDSITRAQRIRRQAGDTKGDFSLREMIDGLGEIVLYEVGVVDGRLMAVILKNRRARVVELGAAEQLRSDLGHLRFGMRRAARRGRRLDDSALGDVNQALFGSVDLGDGPVLVIPPPSLMSVPWPALPSLRSQTVSVSPSAEMWWRARGVDPDGSSVMVAGGPDLEVAGPEVERVGSVHHGSTTLGPGVTVDQVKNAMEGSAVAHIACHATFQVENPMFSSLRLGDGDLNIYDIERLERPPSLVVLSACDSGYTEARAGDELAGLTSALLSMGTRTVIASVGLVPDSPATSDLMVELHQGLVAGLEPSAALAAAQERAFHDPERFVSAASFICVGA